MSDVRIDIFYGHMALETRMRPDGGRFVGEGRARTYDLYGNLVKDTGWEPTGCVLYWPEDPERRWWEFWK